MKVSAILVAALFVSVTAHADHHEEETTSTTPAAATKPATKTTKTTTTTTTTATDHKDCSTLKGKAKTACEAHEKTAHKTGESHTH